MFTDIRPMEDTEGNRVDINFGQITTITEVDDHLLITMSDGQQIPVPKMTESEAKKIMDVSTETVGNA